MGNGISRRAFVASGAALGLAGLAAPARAATAGTAGAQTAKAGTAGFGAGFPVGPWTRNPGNPVLTADPGHSWESSYVYNPAAIVHNGQINVLYRAQGSDLVSSIGLAVSDDGVTFQRFADPVLAPSSAVDSHGCEDPRVVQVGDTFYLTYTSYDGTTPLLSLATSTDLRNWTKHGPLFPDFITPGAKKPRSKSGAILTEPIDGTYYMYFGDNGIFYATSTDLLTWKPFSTPVVPKASDDFTAHLVEAGPQPVINDAGLIVLVHNAAQSTDSGLVYAVGQALIDPAHPTACLARMTQPFLRPEEAYETDGQVPNVLFAEGLVQFKGTWYLYYGGADTVVGLATYRAE
ncbi:glycoside hydrolase family 130 protein [Amycolatopsis ultiminotia]|uniref:Glycoside hydrolase family 130 protein n=1 Tax=Amycolatopsis ultiminotia TaxID=543629 RepID=A0ABP6V0T2_9PSEU